MSREGEAMRMQRAIGLVLLLFAVSHPVSAQVDKVVGDAKGIT